MGADIRRDPLLRGVPEIEGLRILGPCALFASLGRGGMAAVYLGWHTELGVKVAVKCLKPGLAEADREFVARFHREARIAARIEHPNLIRVYDVGREGGVDYLVLDYVEGETAKARVDRRGPQSPAEAVAIVFRAARGLAAAHRRGIIHRDIKPDNILISTAGKVKLADLGLAKVVKSGGTFTASQIILGTPAYMPPEQYEGMAGVGPASDVYALGATLYFFLAGTDAYSGESNAELMHRVLKGPFPDVREAAPGVPSGLAEIIGKSTARKPEDRYPDAVELLGALRPFFVRVKDKSILRDPRAGGRRAAGTRGALPPGETLARIRAEIRSGRLPGRGASRARYGIVAAAVFVAAVALILGVAAFLGGSGDGTGEEPPADTASEPDAGAGTPQARGRYLEARRAVLDTWRSGEIEAAIPHLREMRDLRPDDAGVAETLARARKKLEAARLFETARSGLRGATTSRELADVVVTLEDLLGREPTHPDAASELATARRRLVQMLEAEERFGTALRLATKFMEATDPGDEETLGMWRSMVAGLRKEAVAKLETGVHIEKPPRGTRVGEDSVLLQGTVDYDSELEVRLEGREDSVEFANRRFDAHLGDLPDGRQSLTVVVTDAENGISAKESVEFTVDTRPPEVTIALPSEQHSTSTSPVRIEGTAVDEWSEVREVRVAGAKVALRDGKWSADLYLEPGEHTIDVVAEDTVGHRTGPVRRTVLVRPHDLGVYATRRAKRPRSEVGADEESDSAAFAALDWLRRHQSPDGGWRARG